VSYFITSSLIADLSTSPRPMQSSHPELSYNLLFPASNSTAFGYIIYALPIYPYVRPDLLTVLCLMYHHITISGFLIIGAGAHASIFIIGDPLLAINLHLGMSNGRDFMISWLIYLGIFGYVSRCHAYIKRLF
jgi:photosystem I P700 chlorophyll a apoprotein A1